MKIERFDKKNAAALHLRIVEAIRPIVEEYGATVKEAGGTIDPGWVVLKLRVELAQVDGLSQAHAEWNKHAPLFGFTAEDFGATFQAPNGPARIVGINVTARKRPLVYELIAQPGKRWVMEDRPARVQLGRLREWEKEARP